MDIQFMLNRIKSNVIAVNRQNFDADSIKDLIQQTELLSLEAINRFDGDLESEAFRTYAKKYIYGGITAFVLNQGDITIPAATRYEYTKILELKQELEKKGQRVSAKKIAELTGKSLRTVKMAISLELLLAPAQRLNQKINTDTNNDESELGELIASSQLENIESNIFEEESTQAVRNAINELPIQEQKIVKMLMEGKSANEIIKTTGQSSYFVHKTKSKAFRRLRQNSKLKEIKEMLDAA